MICTNVVNLILLYFNYSWLANKKLTTILSNNFWCNWLNVQFKLNLIYDSNFNYTKLVDKTNIILNSMMVNGTAVTLDGFHYMLNNLDNDSLINFLKSFKDGPIICLTRLVLRNLDIAIFNNTYYRRLFALPSGTGIHVGIGGVSSPAEITFDKCTVNGKAKYNRIMQVIKVKTEYIGLSKGLQATGGIKTIMFSADLSCIVPWLIDEDFYHDFILDQMKKLQYEYYSNYLK